MEWQLVFRKEFYNEMKIILNEIKKLLKIQKTRLNSIETNQLARWDGCIFRSLCTIFQEHSGKFHDQQYYNKVQNNRPRIIS